MVKKEGPLENIKHYIVVIAIALVFVFFVAYFVQTVYPAPKYEDYCEIKPRVIEEEVNQTYCEGVGGKWQASAGTKVGGYCDYDYTCSEEYDSVREGYENFLFYFNLVLGLIVVVVSFFLAAEAVSAGFLAGGVIQILYGTIRNWVNLSDIFRTIMLGVALVVLVYVGYKKLK